MQNRQRSNAKKTKKQKQKTNNRLAHDNYLIEVWFPAYSRHISQNIV